MSWSATESELEDRPKTLKWEEMVSKELIIVVCELQMFHAQSNAHPVSREIRKATLARSLENFGIASKYVEKLGAKKQLHSTASHE